MVTTDERIDPMTLTDFLLARIADDEAAAESGGSHPDRETFANDNYGYLWVQPARVLAECEAKRRIVELRYSWNLQAERMPEPPFGPILEAQVSAADATLRALAAIYADHPDYRQQWAL